jgi:hypothetical protein
LLKCGIRGTPCRTHLMTLDDCPEEWWYTWPIRHLQDHRVFVL